jgi:hypothetical protein
LNVWTVLVIYLLDGTSVGQVRYPSLPACEAATRAVGPTLGYDHLMRCEPTNEAASSVRPQRNPRREMP